VLFAQNVAKKNFDIKSALNAQKLEKDANKMAGDDDMGMNIYMNDISIPAGMGGDSLGTPNVATETSGNFTLDFDNGKGMMNAVNGSIYTKLNMLGAEITTNSKLTMSLIP
jgi:hypothetical protein